MQADSEAARRIRLIATDLDGTLIGSANEFPLYSVFRDRINELRDRNGAVWAACTGRSLRSFKAFFAPMRTMGLWPDYVVLRHAFIYRLTRYGYLPNLIWNAHICYQLWSNQLYVKEAIREWHAMIMGASLGVSTVRRNRNRLILHFDSNEAADVAGDMLRKRTAPYRHLKVFRYHQEVDVRAVPFTKGLAVAELASHLGIDRESVLAIGNGHNDISMLEGGVARYTGCPSNSEPEVVEVVHQSGGHIAGKRSLSGVLEILDATRKGDIDSALPRNWIPPSQRENPDPRSRRPPRDRRPRKRSVWLIPAVVYAVLVVFASFGLIPFSDFITKPFQWLAIMTERLLDALYRG